MGKTKWPATLPSLDDNYWATPAEIAAARMDRPNTPAYPRRLRSRRGTCNQWGGPH